MASGAKVTVRQLVRRVLPARYLARRHRRHQERVRDESGVTALARRFTRTHGCTVLRGPFEGLSYPEEILLLPDAPVAKLVGAYEG